MDVTESIKVMSLFFIGVLNGASRISNEYKKNNIDLLLSEIAFKWINKINSENIDNSLEISLEKFEMKEVLTSSGKYFSFE